MKVFRIIALSLLVILGLMQFYRPKKNSATTVPRTDIVEISNMPQNVAQDLHTACYDCHSNTTHYPWYNNVAPVSYWLNTHITKGKRHLNFSKWDTYSTKKKAHKLEEMYDAINQHWMPLDSYLWMHKEARLSQEQVEEMSLFIEGYSAQLAITEKRPE